MLLLKPSCECCDKNLPPDAPDAVICTYECTFCAALRDRPLRRPVPELRRQLLGPADPPAGDAREAPGLDEARAEAAPGMCCRGLTARPQRA